MDDILGLFMIFGFGVTDSVEKKTIEDDVVTEREDFKSNGNYGGSILKKSVRWKNESSLSDGVRNTKLVSEPVRADETKNVVQKVQKKFTYAHVLLRNIV